MVVIITSFGGLSVIIDIYSIDWCRDGQLLAFVGKDKALRIYDVRQASIVRTFENIHAGDFSPRIVD